MARKQYQMLIIFALVVAILGGIYYAVVGFTNKDKLELDINVLPTNATITIDGKRSGQGKQLIGEGKHTVAVSAEGFKSTSEAVEVKKDRDNTFFTALTPESSEAQKWAEDHADLYRKQEEKGAVAAQERGMAARKTFPIISLLPYNEDGYTIGYRSPSDNELMITIHAGDSLNRQLALSRIKSWGYNPAEYEIDFTDFTYPLNTQGDQHD